MTGKTSINKLAVPDRDLEAPFNSHALPECPEMSANVRSLEISGRSANRLSEESASCEVK